MSKKFVVVLNKSAEPARLMNAIGHLSIGLGCQIQDRHEMGLITYTDKDGQTYPDISKYGYIVLTTSGNKLKSFAQELKQASLPHTTFLDTMIEGGSDEQVARTQERSHEELTYLAVATFGDKDLINPMTRKFSLYR